jgi:iron complex outermembrane receptor protein
MLLSETAATEQVVNVKGVKIVQARNGTYLVLETEQSNKLKPVFSQNGKMLVADIYQAQLRLPSGNLFDSNKPVKGIRRISVTQVGINKIRVVVIGEFGVPQVQLFDSAEGLVLGMTPAAEQSPPLAQPTPPAQQQANQQQQTAPSSGEK